MGLPTISAATAVTLSIVVAACARATRSTDAARPLAHRESTPARDPTTRTTRDPGPDATGSGFVVNGDGYIVTNRHVVKGCRSIAVRPDSGILIPATAVALHATKDLAVVRANTHFGAVVQFRVGKGIRPGDDVVAIGFPFSGLLASDASVSTGSVNALAGIRNDASVLQMSAAVQQGSSGGPLFDASGNVVGIVVTKLNARIVEEETGDLPQNVNFALKADIARTFLDELSIGYRSAPSTVRMDNADVGEQGRRVTVLVECYR